MEGNQFEFRSLISLISEVQMRVKRINDLYPLNRTDALEWGIEIMRQIGGGNYTENLHVIEKTDTNIVKIPNEVRLIEGIYLAECGRPLESYWTDSNLLPLKYVKGARSNIISPGCSNICNRWGSSIHTFSINYPHLIFNFINQCVLLHSHDFVLDENGIPMYPDEPSTKKAIENYILYNWFLEPFYLGEMDGNRFLHAEEQKNYYVQQAKNFWASLGVLQGRNSLEGRQVRFRKFTIPR